MARPKGDKGVPQEEPVPLPIPAEGVPEQAIPVPSGPTVTYQEPPVIPPRVPKIERMGQVNVPYVKRYPRVIGGVCEFCGILDKHQDSGQQYKLCPHYRAIAPLMCSYCDASRNQEDVVNHSRLNVYEHPDDASKLVVCCDNYKCEDAHRRRFQKSGI